MPALLIASTNPGKLQEFQALLAGLPVDLLSPAELGPLLEVVESGKSYAENAALKALAYARHSGLLTLADDTGLEVEALEGGPGLFSQRFVPRPGATDADRRTYLLLQLRGHPRPWLASFRCVVALATPLEEVHLTEGACPGEIIPQERGEHGFGYDPIFMIPETGRTMAELSLEEKNRVSHRARAVQAALPVLHDLVKA